MWGTFTKFREKNVLCEIGDEITRFDGTPLSSETEVIMNLMPMGDVLFIEPGLEYAQKNTFPRLSMRGVTLTLH
jgi:hypothetical protein